MPIPLNKRHLHAYLLRMAAEQEAIIDKAPVFGKRYGTAVDELEEIEDLINQLHKL